MDYWSLGGGILQTGKQTTAEEKRTTQAINRDAGNGETQETETRREHVYLRPRC